MVNKGIKYLAVAVLTLLSTQLFSQSLLDRKIEMKAASITIEQALSIIEKEGDFSFMYSNAIPIKDTVAIQGGIRTVKEWLDLFFDQRVKVALSNNKIILQSVGPSKRVEPEMMTLYGHVYDSLSGELLNGSSIVIEDISIGVISNSYGFYSMTIPIGTYRVRISHIGYTSYSEILTPTKRELNFFLKPSYFQLSSVEVNDAWTQNLSSSTSGHIRLTAPMINKIPALAGEVDIFRGLQFFPGIKSSSEVSSGLSVRGGNLDQNMILLDEAPVYNPSHAIGVFSIFNSDAVKDVSLYKGFIPASYGGRLSSVIDVKMKEGNNKKITMSGGVGTISSRLTLEGPYSKKRGSFLVSGRYTYADALTRTVKFMRDNHFRFYFYDLNAKGNLNVNPNNRIYLSLYSGEDVNQLGIMSDIKWKNATGTLRWNHIFTNKLFVNTTFLYSNYRYEIRAGHINPFSWLSGIRDLTFKSDFNFFPNTENQIVAGVSSTHHDINPGRSTQDKPFAMAQMNMRSFEHAIYFSNEQTLGRFLIQYGLRYSIFQNIGKATIYKYDNMHRVIDSTNHQGNGAYHTSGGLEPRLAIRYSLNTSSALKASYGRTYQYLQLLSNSSFGLSPFDTWFPSGSNIAPQKADQVSLGYFKNLRDNSIEISAEIYHRWLYNQYEYADHAQLLFNSHLEGELRFGSGKAYGIELLLRKNIGQLTGWVGYNYSRTQKSIEEISDKPFNANYDQPHSVSLITNYKVSPRVEVSAAWVYATGRPTTLPIETFSYKDYQVPVFGERNSTRLPDYHRLDVSVTLHSKIRKGKSKGHDWVFAVYNLYARKNPMMVFLSPPFGDFKSNTGIDAYQVSVLPFFPSVTYNFKF